MVLLFILALIGLVSGTEVAKKASPPVFFLQDSTDGLCLAGSTFTRCSIDTLWFVSGSPGSYRIHKRPRDEGDREQCLAKKTCNDDSEEIRLSKCTHCGSTKWNVLGDSTTGYVLSFDDGKTCLVREEGGNKALAVACDTSDYNYTPLQLNFANSQDVKAMNSEGARLVSASANGEKSVVRKYLKEGVSVNAVDWDNLTPLIAASSSGHLDVVKVLVGAGADVEMTDKDGINALMEASISGKLQVVKYLIDQKADPTATTPTGVNALWLAAAEGRDDVVKYLLGASVSPLVERNDGITALSAACVAGHLKVVEVLLRDEEVKREGLVDKGDREGLTPIMNSCENGNVDILQLLIKSGGDVNKVSVNGFTPLIVASAAGSVTQVEILLKAGAKVDQIHSEGVTALMYAAASGHLDVAKLLVKEGADVGVKHSNGGTALMETGASLSENNHEIMEFLISKGAQFDLVDNDGVTPLMSAASQGQCKCVDLLISHLTKKLKKGLKEHVNLAANSGGSALMFAAGAGKVECLESLIKAGADIHMLVAAQASYLQSLAEQVAAGEEVEEHVDGINSLMIAAAAGHLGVVQTLLEAGAEVNVKDEEDKTALAAAVKANHGEIASLIIENGGDPNEPYIDEDDVPHNLLMDSIIVENSEFAKLLISKGADVSHVDETGVSTVLQASHRGLTDVVEMLLKSTTSKADLNAANEDGISPIIAAASEGHEEIVNLLLAAGASPDSADKDSTTALMAGAVRGHTSIVSSLLKSGASIDSQNVDGHTALMFSYNGLAQVRTLWDRYKAYLEEATEEEDVANSEIITEALKNHTAVVELLVKSGADQSIKDNEGHTAMDFDFKDVPEDVLELEKEKEDKRGRKKKKRKDKEL
ncbi:hypothetical protein TrCOL_g5911 [Triparma columacea]|uniref:Uncharacterized protein n=1 Tax=Triparma columacea TaxID=722753 RepID=A0A9W7GQZ8_9STRA|nr:hypothetical protein TrCOL_g5911 [Triparma columacea]